MLYFSSVFNSMRRVTDKKAMRQDFGAENWPELAAMAAEDLAGWLLDLVRCYAWSGAMPGPVLCLVRCYAWSGAMPDPVLCLIRCYA
jgi:hypothetical protein